MASLTRLMVAGQIELHQESFQIVRGMTMLDKQGHALGKVAAVLKNNSHVSHVLLGSPQEQQGTLHYRLIPTKLISKITEEAITFQLSRSDLKSFPIYHPEF